MPIHEFRSNLVPPTPLTLPGGGDLLETSHVNVSDLLLPINVPSAQIATEYLKGGLLNGFEALDEAMLNYFSDIRVPYQDGYRFLRIKIAGGDRSVQIWKNELNNGRTTLPVAAIDRTGDSHNKFKYSPPILPMKVRYLNREKSKAAKVFRPAPFNVEYTMLVWAEHKTDMEYIHHQIATRFSSSMAEFRMSDGRIQGNVQVTYGGQSDTTDKEVGERDYAYRRREYKFTAESWLALPEMYGHTVLGRVRLVNEEA